MPFFKLDHESLTFLKNSKWLFASHTINAVATFAKSILIARGLGVDIFGTYIIITTFVLLVQEFFDLQIGSAVIKFGAEYRARKDRYALTNLIQSSYFLSIILALASIVAILAILKLWQKPFVDVQGLRPYIIVLAVCSGITLLARPCTAILQLHSLFMINALLNIGIIITELIVVAVTLSLWPGSIIALIIAVSLMYISQTVILNLSMCRELANEISFFENVSLPEIIAEVRKIWRFVLGTSGSNTLKKLINRGDVLLLAALSGATQVGFYAIAKKMAAVIKIVTDPLALTIYPQVATLIAERKFEQVKKMILKITGLSFVPFVFFILLLVFLGDNIISLAYGVEYLGGAQALLFLTAAIGVEAILFWSVSLLNSLGLVAIRFTIYLAAAVAGFLIAFALTPAFGAVGMAIALLVANIFIHGMFVGAAAKRIRKMHA